MNDPGARTTSNGASDEHVRPFVYEANGKRALYFSICAIQSRIDLRHPDRLELEYTRLMMAFLLLQPRPARVAMIGLGGGSLERFCVIESDGARFVRKAGQDFDVLMVDGYDTWGLPRRLSTQRFFDDCARTLRPGGVLTMNLYTHPERQVKVLKRIHRSFGGMVLSVPDSDRGNRIAFACHGPAASALHPGPMAQPRGLDAEAWGLLQGAFARVLGAWKDEFA